MKIRLLECRGKVGLFWLDTGHKNMDLEPFLAGLKQDHRKEQNRAIARIEVMKEQLPRLGVANYKKLSDDLWETPTGKSKIRLFFFVEAPCSFADFESAVIFTSGMLKHRKKDQGLHIARGQELVAVFRTELAQGLLDVDN